MGTSGAILVGGKSQRMGVDKPTLLVGGRLLIERVIDALTEVVDEVLLVGRGAERFARPGLPCAVDLVPGVGPLAGIYTALATAHHPLCLVMACDMPFLQPALLAYLLDQAPGWDAVVPRVDGHLEPLHAVYARSSLPAIERMLERGERCPLDLYPHIRVRYIESDEIATFTDGWRSFVNLNTPEDLAMIQMLDAAPAGGKEPREESVLMEII